MASPTLLHIWTELLPDAGEDAPPLLLLRDAQGILAVSDGLGGAGAMQYEVGDQVFTGAYLASRAVLDALRSHLEAPDAPWSGEDWEQGVAATVQKAIDGLVERHGMGGSLLRSKVIKRFPATLSLLRWQRQQDGFLQVSTAQVGDSRAWMLHPLLGLQALTRDDAVGHPDAFAHLQDGAPMSQVICADHPFQLTWGSHLAEPDVLLLCGTDGCFDYLRHPVEWEWMLLDALMAAASVEEWQRTLQERLLQNASDDITLALAVPDGAPVAALQERFKRRHAWLKENLLPVLDLPAEQAPAARQELWQQYKPTYEALLPPPPAAPAEDSLPAEQTPAESPAVKEEEDAASSDPIDIPID